MELRGYQKEAIEAIQSDLKEHQKLGVILPTGSGKTVIMNYLTNWFVENTDQSVLILSHKVDLTVQTKKRYREWYPYESVGVLQAEKFPAKDCRVVIGTMQTTKDVNRIRMYRRLQKHKVGLVIIDEAHRIQCESYDKILYELRDAKVIGFTATPYRSRQLMLNYFDKVSYTKSLNELISNGFLVPPVLKQIEVDEKSDSSTMLAGIIHLYKQNEMGKKAIVYCRTKDEASEMAALFEHIDVKATAVTDNLKGHARTDVFKKFSKNTIDVLTTVNVLTEGYDEPKVEAIFMPFPTSSPSVYMQRIGRGLRISEGKTECRVYVCGDAPSIKRGYYDKLHEDVLDHTIEKREDTYMNDLQFEKDAMSSDLVKWTQVVCEAIAKLNDMKCGNLSIMLNQKNFPDKFMNMIGKFNNSLDDIRVVGVGDGSVTAKQADALKRVGFGPDLLETMNKRDASVLISFMMGSNKDDGVITSGKMAGKHVSELPFYYKKYVMEKFPNSNVATMIKKHNGG